MIKNKYFKIICVMAVITMTANIVLIYNFCKLICIL